MIKYLSFDEIRLDGGTQSRECLDEGNVTGFAADMKRGDLFPPVVVFHDKAIHWLADGFTRYFATRASGQTSIRAEVRAGTRWDAVLYAAGANHGHGQRRTLADRRRQILMVLSNPVWFARSDNWIAKQVRVERLTVQRVRRMVIEGELALFEPPPGCDFTSCPDPEAPRTGADGKKYPVRKRPREDEEEDDPLNENAEPDFLLPGQEDYTPAPAAPLVDGYGVLVPEAQKDVFTARWHYDHALLLVKQLSDSIRSAAKSAGGHYLTMWLKDENETGFACDALGEVTEILNRCRPHGVMCRQCRNRKTTCDHCGGKHFDYRDE